MVIVLVSSICVCTGFLSCITGLDVWDKLLLLMKTMFDNVSRRVNYVGGWLILLGFVWGDPHL